jgi:enamine deaminase RidA (YjgF/YER057c/UK114 family)
MHWKSITGSLIVAALFSTFLLETPIMAEQKKQVIVPESMTGNYENFQFAPAMRAGDMLYLSGVVVTLKDGETVENITPAVERAFDEIELVLKEAGASWDDVVDVTSYAVDLDRDMGPMWAVKTQRVPAPYPAWTAIGTTRLFGGDNALIEIKVTAYLPER